MTTTLPAVEIPGDIPLFPVRKFSVREYHHMIDAGILGEDDNVELIEGWIAPKMPRNPTHDSVIQRANRRILQRQPEEWDLRVQCAITTSDSEPEPDFAIVMGDADGYETRHPGPRDIAWIIEVSDTSLAQDRGSKLRVYAKAKIPNYWIVNLVDERIEVHTDPGIRAGKATYRQRQELLGTQTMSVELGSHTIQFSVRDFIS